MILFCDYLNKQNFETTLDVNSFISFCFSSDPIDDKFLVISLLIRFCNRDFKRDTYIQNIMKLFFYITKVYICN